MLKDDSARVPFAVIGVLMIIVSTITAAYLLKMESVEVSNAIADEREGELNDAMAFAKADIDNALNVACIYAEEEVGENPIVNVSDTCRAKSPAEANALRLERMAGRNLSQHLEANYRGGFSYGDYVIEASIDEGNGSITLEPVAMGMTRTVYHPIFRCKEEYPAYYIASIQVKLRATRPGTSLDYTEAYMARALVTSRYPLLEGLTDEYESRLNGSAMLADATAASFAYTWARGYCQYFTGDPANIVDNGDLSLITNAASLLEQGCVYNSVDPVSLASLVKYTYDNSRPARDIVNHNSLSYVNQYNFSNTSRASLSSGEVPGEYRFNADDIVDRELRAAIADPVSRYNVDMAYGCRIHVTVKRTPVQESYNDTGSILMESYPLASGENGTGPFFREVWKAWSNDTGGHGWARIVTVDYVMDEYSPLNGHNDVRTPHEEAAFASGGRSYTDSNLARAVDSYNRVVPMRSILFDEGEYPDGYSGLARDVTCEHNEWVENASVSGLKGLASRIEADMAVTLGPSDYGAYDEMMDAAYAQMRSRFRQNYSAYLAGQDYGNGGVFKTCGAKYAFYKRSSFLEHIDSALNASASSSEEIDKTIDGQLKKYSGSMDSSTLKDGARSSKGLLNDGKMLIPFGLNMTLRGGQGREDPYQWEEDVALAIDQRPNYLGVDEYMDRETGYAVRPLKIRNVCVFALPTDFADSEQANRAVLSGIDAVSGTAHKLANDTVTAETSKVTADISERAKQAIKDRINDALVHDDELQGQVTRDDVETSVDNAFNRRTPGQVVGDMKNGTLQREIAMNLAHKAKSHAESELSKTVDQYVDSYGDYIEGKAEEAAMGAEEKALSYVIDTLSDRIKQAFKDYAAAAATHAEDPVISAALKRIPMGLPLLPPWGWWATMNVWYVEIKGEIPYLAIYDTDNEPVPDAILGQRATVYVRRPAIVREGRDILGKDEPVRFHLQTCTFIIVPPGEQGIGDKLGGWEEKSPGFDEGEGS